MMTKAERAFFLEIERGAQRLRDEAANLKAENAALRAENAAIRGEAGTLDEIFAETAQELGCKQDNEAVLEAIAALRARAVPEVVWRLTDSGFEAVSGAIDLNVTRILNGGQPYSWEIGCGADTLQTGHGPTDGEAKARCEAAFLRLVGCKP